MKTYDKEKFEMPIGKMRVAIVGMLKNRIDKARENEEKTIKIGIHDAAFLLTALKYHWNDESSKKKSEDK
jgi:hypothetical protein